MKLSANILVTHGEHSILSRAIIPIYNTGIFDEILLLVPHDIEDDENLNNSVSLLKNNLQNTLKVHKFKWTGDFCEARNYLLERSKNDYVYWQDCDTVIQNIKVWQEIVKKIEEILPDQVKITHNCYTPIFDTNEIQEGELKNVVDYMFDSSHMHNHVINKNVFRFKGKIHEEPFPIIGIETKLKTMACSGVCIEHKPIKSPILSVKRNIDMLTKCLEQEPNNIVYEWLLNRDKYIIGDFSCIEYFRKVVLDRIGNSLTQFTASVRIGQYNLGVLLKDYDKNNEEHNLILSETETFLRIAMSLSELCAEPYSLLGDVYMLREELQISVDFYQKAMHTNIDNGFEAQKLAIFYKEYPSMKLSQIYAECGQLELALLNNSYHLECLESKQTELANAINFRNDILTALNNQLKELQSK